jgi:DNA repair protein RecN (Recombination protein N)
VGEKLKALSEHSQVICITHLPQVASLADHHFLVGKAGGKKSHATIALLSADQRIDEIARMLAGYTFTDAARESARELMTSKT